MCNCQFKKSRLLSNSICSSMKLSIFFTLLLAHPPPHLLLIMNIYLQRHGMLHSSDFAPSHRIHFASDNVKYSTSVCLKNPTGIPRQTTGLQHSSSDFHAIWHAANKVHETTIPNSITFLLAFISERLYKSNPKTQ